MEDTVEAVKHVPQERVPRNTVERIVAGTIPPVSEEKQMILFIPQGQFPDRVVERIGDVAVRKIPEQSVLVVNVSAQEKPTRRSNQTISTNEKGRCSQTVPDRMFQEAKVPRRGKIDAEKGMEKNYVKVRDAAVEVRIKFGAGDEEKTEKAVPDDRNWLDKNRLAENDEFEAQQKALEEVPADMMTSRQVPASQIMQKTWEGAGGKRFGT